MSQSSLVSLNTALQLVLEAVDPVALNMGCYESQIAKFRTAGLSCSMANTTEWKGLLSDYEWEPYMVPVRSNFFTRLFLHGDMIYNGIVGQKIRGEVAVSESRLVPLSFIYLLRNT